MKELARVALLTLIITFMINNTLFTVKKCALCILLLFKQINTAFCYD